MYALVSEHNGNTYALIRLDAMRYIPIEGTLVLVSTSEGLHHIYDVTPGDAENLTLALFSEGKVDLRRYNVKKV